MWSERSLCAQFERLVMALCEDMMITKYIVRYNNTIEEVEICRETEKSVFLMKNYWGEVQERREAKEGVYFDTWEDARDFLLQKTESELQSARRRLEVAQGAYGNVKGLRAP